MCMLEARLTIPLLICWRLDGRNITKYKNTINRKETKHNQKTW